MEIYNVLAVHFQSEHIQLSKSRLQEIIGSDRSLQKYQTSIDGPIPFTSEAHFRSHDVLLQGQMKSNEGFLGPMEEGFPLGFGRGWRCGQSITHWALPCHLWRCSDVLFRSKNNSQLLSSKLEYKIGKVLHFLCLSCVRTVSWYARASVCSLQRGQLHNSLDWLFHLKIMPSLVWKKSAIVRRRQRHQCCDPQANIQPSGLCYKKGSATSTIWTEHFALHPHGKPVSRAYPMAAVF